MNVWQRLIDHIDSHHPNLNSWRDRLQTHDVILSELEDLKQEVHTINEQLTGNLVEDMITGARKEPSR